MSNNTFKVWGERRRILLTKQSEIDLLHVKANSFCSFHYHNEKINRFVVVKGEIQIETEYGNKVLIQGQEFEVHPPLIHRFQAFMDSIVIELAYVNKGKIKPDDIVRLKQGGMFVNSEELTESEMRKRGIMGWIKK